MKLRIASIAVALAVPCIAFATAHAAGVGKKKAKDRHALVRKLVKTTHNPKFEVIVPKDKDIRAVHIVTPKGNLLSVPTDGFRFGGKLDTQTTNQCGSDQELWTKWVAVDKCCRYDNANRCTATQRCKQDVSTCVNPDGSGTYTATGGAYSCSPAQCPAAGGDVSQFAEALPVGF